jgi:hypothetical protein
VSKEIEVDLMTALSVGGDSLRDELVDIGGEIPRSQDNTEESDSLNRKGGNVVFVLDQNFLLWVCVAIVGGVLGFIIYGCIKGFDNLFPND